MMNSADSWMAGAQSWLAAPCTYTTAKCLSSRVHALQVGQQPRPSVCHSTALATRGRCRGFWLDFDAVHSSQLWLIGAFLAFQRVLDDSAQIRSTLQGFGSVLKEMSQVCDVTALREQLLGADSRVARVQDSFTAPLSELQQAVSVRPTPSVSGISAQVGKCPRTRCLFIV